MEEKIIKKRESESEVIKVSEEKSFRLDKTICGIIYINYRTLFEDKWGKRFFELKNNTLEHWNMKKKHKTCKTIKNISKYNVGEIWKGELSKLFKFKMTKISSKKWFNKKKEFIFGSQNLEHLIFIRNKIILMGEEYDIIKQKN